jgi:hypothetical protein
MAERRLRPTKALALNKHSLISSMSAAELSVLLAVVSMMRWVTCKPVTKLSPETVQAGRIAELDTLAQKFLGAAGDARDYAYKEALTLSESLGEMAKYYIRVMEKVINDQESYIEKESKR